MTAIFIQRKKALKISCRGECSRRYAQLGHFMNVFREMNKDLGAHSEPFFC